MVEEKLKLPVFYQVCRERCRVAQAGHVRPLDTDLDMSVTDLHNRK